MRIQHWVRASVLALGTASFVLPISAQAADDKEGIDEIVVTARKREEALVDVPFSLAVKTGDDLKRAGAQNLEDIAATTAGFTVQNLGPGQSQVAVRGVSAGQIVRDQPGVKEQVGIYLDESPISLSLFTPDLDLYDLNRVEVLRGPQGGKYRNASAGAIMIESVKPSHEVDGFAEFTYGNYDLIEGKAALNIPIVPDILAMRTSMTIQKRDGYTKNRCNGKELTPLQVDPSRFWAIRDSPSRR